MNNGIPDKARQVLIEHVSQSETGLALIDADDRFLYCNPAFIAMFGLEAYSPIGRTHDEFLVWIFSHRIENLKEDLTLDEWVARVKSFYRVQAYHTIEVSLTSGKWLLLTQQLYQSGAIVTVCTDITRSKEAELALQVAYAELERLAMTDELTGVPNRRHFLAQLESERQRALRHRRQTSLAMLDLDHFKLVNDRHGHPAGDEVLKHFTELLTRHMRGEDVVGRLGGEEFALLMPETAPSGAQTVLERLRRELATARLDFIAPGFSYTFSAGVAGLSLVAPATCDHWIYEADQALYRAKTGGRDRTEFFQAQQ